MGLFDRFFKSKEERSSSEDYFSGLALNYSSYNGYQQNKALLLSAVYRLVIGTFLFYWRIDYGFYG
jgi:hypothetical protein